MTRRRYRQPSQEEVSIQADWDMLRGREQTHHCEGCGQDTPITPEYTCMRCGSEDVFDKSLPEWPCNCCGEHLALYKGTCKGCQTKGSETQFNPNEDYGAREFRVFHGSFHL